MTTYATDIYSGDGSQVDFGVTFPFIQRSHVKVFRIENSDGSRTELTLTTSAPTGDEYQWQSDVLIRVGTAPTNVQKLSIERDTPEDQQLVQWADGSYIIAEDLNTSDKQWLYGLQELEDKFDLLTAEAIKYRGTIDLTVDAAPANPQNGDYFINSGSGTVVASWTGLGGDNVQGSEQVIYNSLLGEWQILQTPASQKGVLEVTGTAPIQVDNTDAQRPVVSVDAATTTDAGVITEAASDGVTYGRENGAWVAVANTAVSANPPANPSNGDGWYDLNTGRLYLWINDGDSSQWAEANPGLAGGGASVEVGDTPPANPSDGDLWWDSSDDSGRLYVYYEDGSTNQWVEASPPAAANPTVKVSDTAPANPEPGDLWWDSSETGGDNGGRLYFRYSDGDSVQWVQTSNVGGANGQIWGRTGTTISPATAGDDVDLGTGDLSAAAGTFSGNLRTSGELTAGQYPDTTWGFWVDKAGQRLRIYDGTNAESFRVDFSGTTWIGGDIFNNSPNITLSANGDIRTETSLFIYTGSTPNGVFTYDSSVDANAGAVVIRAYGNNGTGTGGVQLSRGGTSWGAYSQLSLKTELVPITSGLDKVSTLSAVTGRYKTDEEGTSRSFLIADEVQQVLPEAVSGSGTEEDPLSLRYTEVIPLLVSALHDAKARIEALEARLATLEGN